MDSSSLNSPELMNFINEEKQRAMVAEMVAKLTSVCWDKCITGTPGTASLKFQEEGLGVEHCLLSLDETKRPTFIRVCRKKSTEGFQSVPYVVALFSAMLLIYYSTLNADELFLMTINSVGCFIETIYIALYIAYAPKKARIFTVRFFLLLDVVGFCLILLVTQFVVKRPYRARVIGFVCGGLSVSVFAAPLSIMRTVIRTKSVEFMPFSLSLFLTLSAVMWLFYGLLLKDLFVALPNTLGFTFGMAQMILYAIYRNAKPAAELQLPQHKATTVEVEAEASLDTPEQRHHEKYCMDLETQAAPAAPMLNSAA